MWPFSSNSDAKECISHEFELVDENCTYFPVHTQEGEIYFEIYDLYKCKCGEQKREYKTRRRVVWEKIEE